MRQTVTFFVSGRWAEANPQDLRRLEAVPFFEIAFHGYRHPRLIDAPAGTIQAELENGKTALQRLGAKPAPLFRPPYGDRPPELAPLARQDGVLAVMGDVGLGDPDPNRTADVMERDAIRWVQAGSIIVMHVNGRGYATAETVRDWRLTGWPDGASSTAGRCTCCRPWAFSNC
ncbi:MAG: polysaccharide deacetylase family protein [Candidatus Binataceae bacterium]